MKKQGIISHYLMPAVKPVKIRIDIEKAGLTGDFEAYDIWKRTDLGKIGKVIAAKVNSHGAKVFRIKRV